MLTLTSSAAQISICTEIPTRPDVIQLIIEHLDDMAATSPAESMHALDLDALQHESMSFWTVRIDGELAGCAALADLGEGHGEIKSMRTAESARGRGIASTLLSHLIDVARERNWTRLSLETGTQDFFVPARRLYARHGFSECPPFGDYTLDPNSVYMTRQI